MLGKDDDKRVVLDTERAAHWLKTGAQPTDRVERFLDAAGLLKRAAKNNPEKGKPGAKALERLEEKKASSAAFFSSRPSQFPTTHRDPGLRSLSFMSNWRLS